MLPRDASKRGGHLSKIRWIDSEPCANEDEARIRIEHLDKGWYDCIAVKYYDAYNIPETEKIKALRAANTQTYCKVQRTCVCIPFYKCKKRNISAAKLRLQDCAKVPAKKFLPCLRNADLRPETTLNRIAALKAKADKSSDTLKAELTKQAMKAKMCAGWLKSNFTNK